MRLVQVTYDAYKILITGCVASAQHTMFFKLGASVTGYYQAQAAVNYSTSVAGYVTQMPARGLEQAQEMQTV
jgi:hypothetical protein